MYNENLERLIELALVDGVLTEQEKRVLFKKAASEGIDIDEFEMVLNARIYERQKALKNPSTKSDKYGDLKKCPSCGAPVVSFHAFCSSCGHEFKNVEVASSVQKFFERLQEIESSRQEEKKSGGFWENSIFRQAFKGNEFAPADKIAKQKAELISTFPIPNTKEDLLEFLSLAVPRAKDIKGALASFWSGEQNKSELIVNKAFKQKCIQIIMKAEFIFKNDEESLDEIRYYAQELKIKMR